MTLKFRIQDIVAVLPGPFVEKSVITLTLTGTTMAGTEFQIEDCVVIHGTKGRIEPVIADGEPGSPEPANWGSLKNLYR